MPRCYCSVPWSTRLLVLLIPFSCLGLLAQTRMIAHVTNPAGGFDTAVLIHNDASTSQSYTLTPYLSSGTALPPVTGTVASKTANRFEVEDLFSRTDISHFLVQSEGTQLVVSVAYATNTGVGSPAHLRESDESKTLWRVFPGDWDVVFDGFAIVNLGNGPTDVVVRQKSSSGSTINEVTAISGLAPNAKGLYVLGAPAGSAFGDPQNTTFEIVTSQPTTLIALRGTPPGSAVGYLWENSTTSSDAASFETYLASHFTSPSGGYKTTLFVENTSAGSASFELFPYDSSGRELASRTANMPANTVLSFSPENLLGVDNASHLEVGRSSSDLKLTTSFVATSGLSSPAHVSASNEFGTAWLIYSGNWDFVFDGFAVVNLDLFPIDIFIQQYRILEDGNELLVCVKALVQIDPFEKGLYVLGGPNGGTPFHSDPNSYFVIFAPLASTIVPLRGTVPGSDVGVLWENRPISISTPDITSNPYCDDASAEFWVSTVYEAYFTYRAPVAGETTEAIAEIALANNTASDATVTIVATELIDGTPSSEEPTEVQVEIPAQGGLVSDVLAPLTAEMDRDYDKQPVYQVDVMRGEQLLKRQTLSPVLFVGESTVVAMENTLLEPASSKHREELRPRRKSKSPKLKKKVKKKAKHGKKGKKKNSKNDEEHDDGKNPQTNFSAVVPARKTDASGSGKSRSIGHPNLTKGLLVKPENPKGAYQVGDDVFVFFHEMQADIPEADPVWHYQYGLVMDADGNLNNNFEASPQFPGDLYQGTDRWFSLEYTPASGWSLKVSLARNGSIVSVQSDATASIDGSLIQYTVPAAEIEVSDPKYRVTAYAHQGDFGLQGGPWAMDILPPVDEPLLEGFIEE